LAMSQIAQGEERGYAELRAHLDSGAPFRFWNELGRALTAAPPSPARAALLLQLAATRADGLPPLLLALAADEVRGAGDVDAARGLLARAEAAAESIDEPETLRRLALA